ncbi:hypothetical protein HPSA_05025 [Helicobacter pylori SouthAfrica7]|uniref:Uncharacterized protein n=1 Tax=Helicobacter pylori (strain SouthAfrica7) TaxID=907239 RepID=E8QSL8_HELPW|nr:hypothetical protein HPSA_05025 [Helicobacter pylori SouthAfrica7]
MIIPIPTTIINACKTPLKQDKTPLTIPFNYTKI